MVTKFLIIFTFFVALVYAIVGTILSSRLSKYIEYEGGFLKLWNIVQFHILSAGKLDFQLTDETAQKYFYELKRFIIFVACIYFPLLLVTCLTGVIVG